MNFNKIVSLVLLAATLVSSVPLLADGPYAGTYDDATAYQESSSSANMAPGIALGVIAVVALALLLNDGGHRHHRPSHFHAHSL